MDQTALTPLAMTSAIVAAFVGNNSVHATDLPKLIETVYASVVGLNSPKPAEEPAANPKPAVSVKKSITDEYIISLEDGRKFKSMKRYLSRLGMTPAQYRAKWGLTHDYPMVAPGYAAKRSALAKQAGLGSARRQTSAALAPDPVVAAPAVAAVKRRGRAKKAV